MFQDELTDVRTTPSVPNRSVSYPLAILENFDLLSAINHDVKNMVLGYVHVDFFYVIGMK